MDHLKYRIKYRKAYKYVTEESVYYATLVKGYEVDVPGGDGAWVKLDRLGGLFIRKGYSWNGANVVPDTVSSMAPALVHDAFYQMFQEAILPTKKNRKIVDKLFRDMLKANGMGFFRRTVWYLGVRIFGGAVI
jgi:hypothetical protein